MSDRVALLRRNPFFARFLVGEAIALGGDWFSVVAVSVLAVQHGGGHGAWAVGVTLAAHELPRGLVRPMAGVLADRFDRRNLLASIHLGQLLLTLLMAERAFAADLLGVQILVVARSLLGGLDGPARAGAIRRLVVDDDLFKAHAIVGALWSSMFAFGMALGGVVASYGAAFALLVDAGTFAVAGLLMMTLPPMPTRGAGSLREAARQAVGDLREATSLAGSHPELLRAVTAKVPLALAGGAGVVMLNVVSDATAFVGTGAATLGLLQATRGIGTGVGPVVAERLVAGGTSLAVVWRGVVALGLLGVAALALASPWYAIVAAAALWGFGTGANWMISTVELQRRAPDATIGRLSGLDLLAADVSFAVSALAGGAIVEAWGTSSAAGALGVLLGVASWLLLQRAAGRVPTAAPVAQPTR